MQESKLTRFCRPLPQLHRGPLLQNDLPRSHRGHVQRAHRLRRLQTGNGNGTRCQTRVGAPADVAEALLTAEVQDEVVIGDDPGETNFWMKIPGWWTFLLYVRYVCATHSGVIRS